MLEWLNNQLLRMDWLAALVRWLLENGGLDTTTRLGGSLHFFIYDVIKIFILLGVLIFSVSWIQSYFPPERTRRILGGLTGMPANIAGALLGTLTPFCSCSAVPLFIGFVCVMVMMIKREAKILRKTLAAEVDRGLIDPEQLEIAISVFRRSRWVMTAFGDSKLFNARRQYLRSVAKLGLCHWHNSRAEAARGQTGSFSAIPKLQAEVFSLRGEID